MRYRVRLQAVLFLWVCGQFGSPACQAADEAPGAATELAATELQQWGEETLETIRKDFWLDDRGLYAEELGGRRRGRSRRPAYMWSAGVQLSALAAAAHLAPEKHVASLAEYAAVMKTYWDEHNGTSGYDVQPSPRESDRYYDDNAWIVLGLADAYEITNDPQYLDDAIATLKFVMSGEDDQLGGGLYWREKHKESKNTCTNAPATVGALRLYQLTKQEEYLETAKRIYAWTCKNLQEEESGLFLDNIALDGRVDRRKYSYNSALMIRANCLFYEVTGEQKYLEEAQRIAKAAEKQWVVPETGAMKDTGKFAHMLIEAFLAVQRIDGDSHWLETSEKSVRYVHNELRTPEGRYPGYWVRSDRQRRGRPMLIDQASVARAYLVVAAAVGEQGESKGE